MRKKGGFHLEIVRCLIILTDMTNSSAMLIGRIHDLTHRWLTEELSSAGLSGVVPSHGDILALLMERGEASMHELAEFAHRTRPTTTVLVAKLEQMGLVAHRRSESDGRSTLIALTERGEALRPVFESVSRRLIEFIGAGLTAGEAVTLERLLKKTLAGMSRATQTKGKHDEGNQKDG